MALTASDRKVLSKKYVDIPDENLGFAANIVNLNLLIADFQAKDLSFKNLFDSDNAIINLYHPEIDRLAGHLRTSIVEQDMQDSAVKVIGNFFFPNDFNTPTPTLPDGIWKELKSYARNSVLGKNYQEVFNTQDSETTILAAISALTTSIATDYTQLERQTGDASDPPNPPDTVDLDADLQAIKDAVNAWQLSLDDQKTALLANTDPDQTTEIAAALAAVNASLAEITTWEALTDYAVGGKLDDSGLQVLDDEVAVRGPLITSRIAEIDARLGTVTQNLDGSIASFSGLYGARYVNIDSRLNLAEGSLTRQAGLELAKRVQTENISNNNNYLQYLTDNVLIANKFAEEPTGTNDITVADATEFSISDTVFIVSETQAELTGTVTNKVGNILTLSFIIPTTFTIVDVSRILREV